MWSWSEFNRKCRENLAKEYLHYRRLAAIDGPGQRYHLDNLRRARRAFLSVPKGEVAL